MKNKLICTGCMLLVFSCTTYYQAHLTFNHHFENGDMPAALKALESNTSEEHGKLRFLHFSNLGLALSMMGRYEESNQQLEKAFLFGEDYRLNHLREAASYLTNPMVTEYRGEDHEHLMVLYYKAMNYLKMNNNEDALVECRRLAIRLQQLSDRYDSESKYRRDAFVHTLMGIIYDADGDFNNAFIAYRNALEVYQQDYERIFGYGAPDQLKKDLLRAAWRSDFRSDFEKYKSEFGMDEFQVVENDAELVFFWHNGLAPVKTEWSVNFFVDRQADRVIFFNNDLGFSFPFELSLFSDEDKKGLSSLEVFRVAFPRYYERPPLYQSATISDGNTSYTISMLENINRIAHKSLEQRMHLEFSKALIRVALKKAAEYQAKKEDKGFGSLLGLVNALTEKADTRNWQTLPYSISYSRIPFREGKNTLSFTLEAGEGEKTSHEFTYVATKGKTLFHTFSSMESIFGNKQAHRVY